jgi:hypothetical protein
VTEEKTEGDLVMPYKLTIYPVMDTNVEACATFKFATKDEMLAGKNTCADLLLYLQDQIGAMDDESNMFTCEEFVDGEWEEWRPPVDA